MIMKYRLKRDNLQPILAKFGRKISSGVVILKGDLAAGKTTLVQEVVKALGKSEAVTSPTFSLQQCYGDNIYHYDIYNHGLEHFISLGMLEELDKEGLHFVEWGDDELVRILSEASIPTVVIEIEKISDDEREYRVDYAHA
jgi:tRNA threonylcarbamoyladenosine biosynthesis protein TsaE